MRPPGAEVADARHAAVDADANLERSFDAFGAPFVLQLRHASLHLHRHAHRAQRVIAVVGG